MYSDTYYERQKQKYEKQRAIAALAMSVCVEYIDFKKEKTRTKVRDKIKKLQSAELAKMWKAKNALEDSIKNTNEVILSTRDVQSTIEAKLNSYRVTLEYKERSSLARNIANNPEAALREYASSYVYARENAAELEKQREEDIKKKAEELREKERQRIEAEKARLERELQREERRKEREQQRLEEERLRFEKEVLFKTTLDDRPYRDQTIKTSTPVINDPFYAETEEESKRLAKERIDKKTKDGYTYADITTEERKSIKKLYPELDFEKTGNNYYRVETLNKGMEIDYIANMKDIYVADIMNIGILTLDVVTKELLEGSRVGEPELFAKIGIRNSLEKYKIAYNKYMNYYRNLDSIEKDKISKQIEDNNRYVMNFGKLIITPEGLKSVINHKVTEYIINNYRNFYNYQNGDIYTKTMNATKYMTIEEIVSLYKGIENDLENQDNFGQTDEEREAIEEGKIERIREYQEAFALVIETHLEKNKKPVDMNKLSVEEQIRMTEEETKKLAAIINDILREKPLSPRLREILETHNLEGKGTALLEAHNAKEEAKGRLFGMSKVKKAFAQISGKWARYLMLMEKEDLNDKEKEELNGMFR